MTINHDKNANAASAKSIAYSPTYQQPRSRRRVTSQLVFGIFGYPNQLGWDIWIVFKLELTSWGLYSQDIIFLGTKTLKYTRLASSFIILIDCHTLSSKTGMAVDSLRTLTQESKWRQRSGDLRITCI